MVNCGEEYRQNSIYNATFFSGEKRPQICEGKLNNYPAQPSLTISGSSALRSNLLSCRSVNHFKAGAIFFYLNCTYEFTYLQV